MEEQAGSKSREDLLQEVRGLLDERFDVEALAQSVEHQHFCNGLNEKLRSVFRSLENSDQKGRAAVVAMQGELRELIMDVALLKRAVVSLGQIGVMERRRIERELVLELFPPNSPRAGAGIKVIPPSSAPISRVECEDRLPLCKAACCRIFDVPLTADEVRSGVYDWDARVPYNLRREHQGCAHIKPGGCACTVYGNRPTVCRTYSCKNDGRIWADFENKVLNPELKARLESLDVATSAELPRRSLEPSATMSAAVDVGESLQPGPAPNARRGAGVPETPAVPPPDFGDLRRAIVPMPRSRFTPPNGHSGEQENGDRS